MVAEKKVQDREYCRILEGMKRKYPGEEIRELSGNPEPYFHEAVSAGRERMLLLSRKAINMERIMKDFHEKSACFYPNLTAYRVTAMQYPASGICFYELAFSYRIGRVMQKTMEAEVKKEVKRLTELLFLPEMPPSARCLLAHNYLASQVTYYNRENCDPLERSYLQSAYGALIRHACVCQGYAEAYMLLLRAGGIRCRIVHGSTDEGSGNGHAWNIVELPEKKLAFHVDVTWDAAGKSPALTYFGRSDAFWGSHRTWNRYYCPVCSDAGEVTEEGSAWLRSHRRELLAHGIEGEWLECCRKTPSLFRKR